MKKYSVGNIIKGKVKSITPYGAYISFPEDYTGLLHISEISNKYVKNIKKYFSEGDEIFVEILGIKDKHLKLSIKNIEYKYTGNYRRKELKETENKFYTLKAMLPIWKEKKLKSLKKELNSIDK